MLKAQKVSYLIREVQMLLKFGFLQEEIKLRFYVLLSIKDLFLNIISMLNLNWFQLM